MASNLRAYAREVVWVIAAQAASFFGGLATVKAAAVVLGPSEYGKLSASLAIMGIAQVCLYGAISQAAMRFLVYAELRSSLKEYLRSLALFAAIATAAIGMLWALASATNLDGLLPLPGALICIYAALGGLQMVAIAVCNAGRRRRLVAIALIVDALARPLLILVMARISISTADTALIAYSVSATLLVVILGSVLSFSDWSIGNSEIVRRQDAGLVTGKSLIGDMASFAGPFVVFGILGAIGSHGERLLLAEWATWAEVGSYALMAQLVMTPNVLFTAIVNQFYLPIIFEHDPDGVRTIDRSFRIYILFSIFGVVVITAAAATSGPLIIPLFSSRAFLGHEHLLWLLGLSAGLFCFAQQLVLPGIRMNKPEIYMPAKLIHSLALLALSLFLVPRFGVDGMGVSALLSSTAYLCATMLANAWLKRSHKAEMLLVRP